MTEYICKYCNKKYKSQQSRSNHYRLYHSDKKTNNIQLLSSNINIQQLSFNVNINKCTFCNKEFKNRQNKWEHQKKHCKNNSKSISNEEKSEPHNKVQPNLPIKMDYPINNQLIDIIVDKTKIIEELKKNEPNSKLVLAMENRICVCLKKM